MAEFGIKATELSAPSGAGSAPLSPVREDKTAGMETIINAVNIFGKGLGIKQQEDKDALNASIVGGYAKKLESINEGLRTGQISPSEASSRSRAVTGEYMAGYSHLYKDLKGVREAMFSGSDLGKADERVSDERTLRNSLKTDAQKSGYDFLPYMTEAQENSQIAAFQAETRMRQEMGDSYKRNEEKRAQGRYDADTAAREAKEMGIRLINDVATKNFDATYDALEALRTGVTSNKIPFEEAQTQWAQKIGRIEAQIQAAAGVNTELAGPYRSLFAQLGALGKDMLDPNKANDALKAQIDALTNQAKLTMLQKPKVAAIVAASQLLGQNAQLALRASPIVTEAISSILTDGPDSPSVKQPIIGNPEVEKDTLKIVSESIKQLNSGKFQDNDKARGEVKNSVDNLLQQFGDMVTKRGTNPKMLQSAVDFFSSPEFGIYAKSADFDIEALDAAKKTFQVGYQQSVIDVIDRTIRQVVTVQDRFGSESAIDAANRTKAAGSAQGGSAGLKQEQKPFDTSKVQPVFNGTGVSFKLTTPSTTAAEVAMERRVAADLKQVSTAITKLIHIGAHMEGTTDYNKFWEKNKATILPQFFIPDEKNPSSGTKPQEGLKFSLEKDLKAAASFTEAELKPDTAENIQRRKEQDIIAIKAELARKTISPEAKRILEAELKKLEQ